MTPPQNKHPRWPWPSLLVTIAASLIFSFEPFCRLLELRPDTVTSGQWWRLITGHLTHWDQSHLIWDALTFGVLCYVWESRSVDRTVDSSGTATGTSSRQTLAVFLLMTSLCISFAVMFARPDLTAYRGLSGLNAGLFTALLMDAIRLPNTRSSRIEVLRTYILPIAFLCAFAGQTLYLHLTGNMLFVTDQQSYEPLAMAHGVGMICGLGQVLISRWRCMAASSFRQSASPQTSHNQTASSAAVPLHRSSSAADL